MDILAPPGPLPIIKHITPDSRHYERWEGKTPRPVIAVVLHSTEGVDSRRWLSTDPASRVSIHVLIQRDGTRIGIVNYADVANHVGYAVAPYDNENCMGIEWENASSALTGRVQAYTPTQLSTGAHWVATILYSYGLTWANVVRHGDIANNPVGRRSDPVGPFPMEVLRVRVGQWLAYWAVCSPEERARTII